MREWEYPPSTFRLELARRESEKDITIIVVVEQLRHEFSYSVTRSSVLVQRSCGALRGVRRRSIDHRSAFCQQREKEGGKRNQ